MNSVPSPKAAGIRLAKIWRAVHGDTFPIDVSWLAKEYSQQVSPDAAIAEVSAVEDLEGFEGGLFWLPQRRVWALLYRPHPDVPGRTNFTVGHELGHFVLHRTTIKEFRCSTDAVLGHGSGRYKEIERDADVFASYLLMPIDDYRGRVSGKRITLELLSECGKRYGVSLTAAALKWLEFTEACAAIVFARDGFIKWFRASDSARYVGLRNLRPGTQLPAASAAAAGYGQLSAEECRSGISFPPKVWAPERGGVEMGLLSDRYDLTISLLLFDSPTYDTAEGSSGDGDDEESEQELVKRWTPHFRSAEI